MALRKKAPDCTGGPVVVCGGGQGSFPMHIAQCTGASMAIAQVVGGEFFNGGLVWERAK